MASEALDGLRRVMQTTGPVVVYASSGTGGWEASLVNTLSPGDRVLMFETGHFAMLWKSVADRLGLAVDLVPGDWRHGVDYDALASRLADDRAHTIKAVAIVHNETSTGVTSSVPRARAAMDKAAHPALLLVDTISSLGSIDYRHDEWRVDVTIGGSQKGLMLPPGLGINAVGPRAIEASKTARLPRAYWEWAPMIRDGVAGYFPYTPATNLLFGLRESTMMLLEETLPRVFARHQRHAEATRRAVRAWGLDLVAADPGEYSATVTAVVTPEGVDADHMRQVILERFDMSLGTGLGKLKGRVFRIGHVGDLNDLMLAGALCGVEMGLQAARVPHTSGGVTAALGYLAAIGD